MQISKRARTNIMTRINKRAPELKSIDMRFTKSNDREYKVIFETLLDKRKIVSVKKGESLGKTINKCLSAFIKQVELQKKKKVNNFKGTYRNYFKFLTQSEEKEEFYA